MIHQKKIQGSGCGRGSDFLGCSKEWNLYFKVSSYVFEVGRVKPFPSSIACKVDKLVCIEGFVGKTSNFEPTTREGLVSCKQILILPCL